MYLSVLQQGWPWAQWYQQCKLLNIQLLLLTALGFWFFFVCLISRASIFLLTPATFFSSHFSSWEAVWVDLGERSAVRQMGIFSPKQTYCFFRQSLSGSYRFFLSFQKIPAFSLGIWAVFLRALIPCWHSIPASVTGQVGMRFGAAWSRKGVPVHGRRVELDDLYCPFQPKPFQDSTSSPLFNWNRSKSPGSLDQSALLSLFSKWN